MTTATELFGGTWVLVTGASSGIGEQFARQLAAHRANLVLTARSGDTLRALADELAKAHGIETAVVAADLGAPGGAVTLCQQVTQPITHLISNAGFGTFGEFAQTNPEQQAAMVRLNCETVVVLARHFLPAMLERKAGGIIHVASIVSFMPSPFYATYGATKAFVLSFSSALSGEVYGSGVRVMAVCPGPVPTGFQEAAGITMAMTPQPNILSAAETVRRGISAYVRGDDVYVPGVYNRLSTWAVQKLPRRMLVRSVAKLSRRYGS
ncbi:MAG TPA: SDR family oxidoreductase [Enhygromyxa sp.]|nr:SDR family oxidoreductase [Enhygromyxa sp.]